MKKISKNETTKNFAVIAGREYLLKVLVLYRSLRNHSTHFRLWICCLDEITYETLLREELEFAVLLKVEQLEDSRLIMVKEEYEADYCRALKSFLIEHLLNVYNLDSVLYCDGDMFFFSDSKVIFDEWASSSIYLCPQTGMIGFHKDENGLEALRWWKEHSDQKYLDQLAKHFSGVKVSSHLGVNASPWNCIYNNGYSITNKDGSIFIESHQLVAYHFTCLTIFNEELFDLWSLEKLNINKTIKNEIYAPYLEQLRIEMKRFRARHADLLAQFVSSKPMNQAKTLYCWSELQKEMDEWDEFYNICTIFSETYLLKGLALYFSLYNQLKNFHMWICCVDHVSYSAMMQLDLKNATILRDKDFATSGLRQAKKNRKTNEYCWTLKPPLCLHILKQHPEVDQILYCDADVYFFSSPKVMFDEWAKYSVLLCLQRGTAYLERISGMYQAGIIGFGRDENAQAILKWWIDRCLEWCFDQIDLNGSFRYGDQKYLELIHLQFYNIKIVQHIGVNTAPWNIVMNPQYEVNLRGEQVYLDDSPLICFHYGSMEILSDHEFDLWKLYPLNFDQKIINHIYTPYIRELQKMISLVRKNGKKYSDRLISTKKTTYYKAKNLFKVTNEEV